MHHVVYKKLTSEWDNTLEIEIDVGTQLGPHLCIIKQCYYTTVHQ